VPSGVDEIYAVANAGGVPQLAGGPLAGRPAPGVPDRLYLVTDGATPFWSRDTGSAWKSVGSSEEAASILAKILTVDGANSGLDADLLDGLDSQAFARSDDPRLTNARTPLAHKITHVTGGTDALSPADIGAVRKAGDAGVTPFTLTRDPQQAMEPATMQYVDAARAGLDLKQSVRLASNANHALTGAQTVDGVAVATGDRVLLKNQTNGAENGIWVANTSVAGAWTRATDADQDQEVTPGAFVFVEEGAQNADTGWVVTNDGPITVGTTAVTWTQFSGPGAVTAGAGLSRTGNQLSVAQAGILAAMLGEGILSNRHVAANAAIAKSKLAALALVVSDFAANRGPWVRVADAAGRAALGAVREGQLVYQADDDSYYQSNSPDGTDAASVSWTTVASAGVAAATETVAGILRLATQALTQGGTDDASGVTPLKLRQELSRLRLTGPDVAVVRRTTMQSIPNNATTVISWDSEVEDAPGWFAPASPTVLTVTEAGFYEVVANLQFATNGTGSRQALLTMGGVTVAAPVFGAADDASARKQVVGAARLAAGDQVSLSVYQNSGGALGFGPALAAPVPSLTLTRRK
jgi:hypothetical protein